MPRQQLRLWSGDIMAVLNPADAQKPFMDQETGKVRFGELNFNNILYNQINTTLYLLTNISTSSNTGDYQTNTNLLEDSIRGIELFLSSHLKKDNPYKKRNTEIEKHAIAQNKLFKETHWRVISKLNVYDNQERKKLNSIQFGYYCDVRVKACEDKFENLVNWMDRKGIHFEDAGASILRHAPGEKK